MTCDEIRQLEAFAEAFGEMRKMVISNPLFSDRYVLKMLNNIISYIILAKEENTLFYNEILDTVKANYRSLFFRKRDSVNSTSGMNRLKFESRKTGHLEA